MRSRRDRVGKGRPGPRYLLLLLLLLLPASDLMERPPNLNSAFIHHRRPMRLAHFQTTTITAP